MLKQLRQKKTAKRIFLFLAMVIVPAFVLWGSGSLLQDKGKTSFAGELFGKKVSIKDYRDAFIAVRTQAVIRFGDNLAQVEPLLNLEERAWERLILLHEAIKQRIKVSDGEVVRHIANYPFFQKDSKFNSKLYEEILTYGIGMPVRDFEHHVRESLEIEKLLKSNAKVSIDPKDVLKEFKEKNEEVKVAYIAFNNADFKAHTTVGDKEAQDYFNANKDKFRKGPQINIEYITTEERTDEDKTQNTQSRELMETILEEAAKGKDLFSLSKEHKIKYKRTELFSIDEPIPDIGWSLEFFNAISKLKVGQISDIIETSSGIYIIKLLEVKEPYLPEFEEAEGKAIESIKQDKAKELSLKKAYEIKDRLLKILKDNTADDFRKAAQKLNLAVSETNYFKRGDYLEKIGISPDFVNACFGLVKDSANLAIASNPNATYLIKLLDFKPVGLERFEKEKANFTQRLNEQKEEEIFYKFLQELKLKANLKSYLTKK